jgi:uncharacterized protein
MPEEITIYEQRERNLSGSLVLLGFPTVGLVSTIAANYTVATLGLERIGGIHSPAFPPAALIQGGTPLPPVRIYAGDVVCGPEKVCRELIVVTSEFTPPPPLIYPLSETLLGWCEKKGCRFIVTLEGIPTQEDLTQKVKTFGVATTPMGTKLLEMCGCTPLRDGIIGGLSGVLLHEGERLEKEIVCLLAEARPEYPNARGAAKLLEVLNHVIPGLAIDPEPLYSQAEKIEERIKETLDRAKEAVPHPADTSTPMYH